MPKGYNDIVNARIKSVLLREKIEKRFGELLSENNSIVFDYIMEQLELNAHIGVDSPFVMGTVPVVRYGESLFKSQQCQAFWSHFEIEGLELDSLEFKDFLTEFKEGGKYGQAIWSCEIYKAQYYFDKYSLAKLLEAENVELNLGKEDGAYVLSLVTEVPSREEIVSRKLEIN